MALLPFTAELSSWSPRSSRARSCSGALGARLVVVGSNFRFGRGRGGRRRPPRAGSADELGFDGGGGGARLARGRAHQQHAHPRGAGPGRGRPGPRAAGPALLRGRGRGARATAAAGPSASPPPTWRSGTRPCRVRASTPPPAGFCPAGGARAAVVNLGRRPTFGGGETHARGPPPGLRGRSLRRPPARGVPGAAARRAALRRTGGPRGADPGRHRGRARRSSAAGRRRPGEALSGQAIVLGGRPMSDLEVETREVDDVVLLYPRGFINAHTVRAVRGGDPEGPGSTALQDRPELLRPPVHRERGPRRDHGRHRGDPRQRGRPPAHAS